MQYLSVFPTVPWRVCNKANSPANHGLATSLLFLTPPRSARSTTYRPPTLCADTDSAACRLRSCAMGGRGGVHRRVLQPQADFSSDMYEEIVWGSALLLLVNVLLIYSAAFLTFKMVSPLQQFRYEEAESKDLGVASSYSIHQRSLWREQRKVQSRTMWCDVVWYDMRMSHQEDSRPSTCLFATKLTMDSRNLSRAHAKLVGKMVVEVGWGSMQGEELNRGDARGSRQHYRAGIVQ